MISEVRKAYNAAFTQERYEAFLNTINTTYKHRPPFRIGETPVFVPADFKKKLFQACEEITDVICQPDFKDLSQGAILAGQEVPGEDDHTLFLQMDFGVCREENGELSPQLIEVQGFPSLYFFQDLLANAYRKHFEYPENFTHLFGGLTSEEYMELLRKNIVGTSKAENVILLEIEPEKQVTRIDFLGATHHLGIPTLCVSDLQMSGNDVFYRNANGQMIQVEKILNRVIFDELINRSDLKRDFLFTKGPNVDWIGHPNWFFRISKHTLPLLKSQYVPDSRLLSDVDEIPKDLQNYVLKPLYSFAGSGVLININEHDLTGIKNKENYILQRKVAYAPVVETHDQPAKCEIRMLMLWEKGEARPRIVNNLARLSKGEMIGVRYNKNKEWVGASVALFES
ncbi:MAG: hypothetical protein AAF502_10780 [Bacteroidota bacterium]